MEEKTITELLELDEDRKWVYLRRYYEVASRFYQIRDRVVSDAEVAACIRDFKEKPAPVVRRVEKLSEWRFRMDQKDAGLKEGYFSFAHDETGWEKVRTPHSIQMVSKDPVRYGSMPYKILAPDDGQRWDIWKGDSWSWYRCRLAAGALREDEVAYLDFDSVSLTTDVWVNEMPVMMGHLGLFPFSMEITDEMGWAEGKDTIIAVRVGSTANNTPYLFYNGLQVSYGNPPYTNRTVPMDSLDDAWAGLAGDAKLTIANRNHIESAFLSTEAVVEKTALVKCRVELRNETWEKFVGRARIEIREWLPAEGKSRTACEQAVTVLPMGDGVVELAFEIKDPALWDVDHPNLYLAHIVLTNGSGTDIDDLYESFGVRTIKMVGSAFYLNNRKIVPRGTHNIANYYKDSLLCPSDRSIVTDILLHKKMGATCSRWPSDARMHYPRMAEYADQLGFMISWAGYFEMWAVHPEMEMYARRDVRKMVRSLRNRPSIIIWEMGDEPLLLLHHHRRLAWYETIYRLVEAEDRSRPIIPAGYWANELVDLITKHKESGLSIQERRRRVLEEYPVFGLELAPWDYHYCPTVPPQRPTSTFVTMVRDALRGERATIFTEFGMDALPKPETMASVYGGFRWAGNQNWYFDKKSEDIVFYKREITKEDWRETQAAQAIIVGGIIGQLRENPKEFAGFYFLALVDAWTFYWGAVDALFNAKLSYFVIASCYRQHYVSGLHGSVVHRRGENIRITASSIADTLDGASLMAVIRDAEDRIILKKEFHGLHLEGDACVSPVGEIAVDGMTPALYAIEFRLTGPDGNELSKRAELFYLQEP